MATEDAPLCLEQVLPMRLASAALKKRKRPGAGSRPAATNMKGPADLERSIGSAASAGLPILFEIFSGVGNVAKAAASLGYASIALDILDGYDVTKPGILEVVLKALSADMVAAVSLGPPCCSWSRARRGKADGRGWPRRLRSKDEVLGLSGIILTAKDGART